jgi:hypothetical protein
MASGNPSPDGRSHSRSFIRHDWPVIHRRIQTTARRRKPHRRDCRNRHGSRPVTTHTCARSGRTQGQWRVRQPRWSWLPSTKRKVCLISLEWGRARVIEPLAGTLERGRQRASESRRRELLARAGVPRRHAARRRTARDRDQLAGRVSDAPPNTGDHYGKRLDTRHWRCCVSLSNRSLRRLVICCCCTAPLVGTSITHYVLARTTTRPEPM